jgi:ubiquinone/menaquinone biosynthesis C-methylase UbiE
MARSSSTDTNSVKAQYQTSANLDARIAIHARFSTARRDFHAWLFDFVTAPSDARVLELGCGSGQMWHIVQAHVPSAWRVTLTDLSYGMLAKTKDLTGTLHENLSGLTLTQSDAQAIPFADATFDVVFANHMLYHVLDLPHALAEIRRVLKRGGMLLAATNGARHMHELQELRRECGVKRAYDALTFNLENGATWLAPHFASVTRHDFEDSLRVTEVEPLVAYVKSMSSLTGRLTDEHCARFRALAAERIARDGAIHITKVVGLFVVRK